MTRTWYISITKNATTMSKVKAEKHALDLAASSIWEIMLNRILPYLWLPHHQNDCS